MSLMSHILPCTLPCPHCGTEVDTAPLTLNKPHPCPHCGQYVELLHECTYIEDTGDEECFEHLEPANSPHKV